MKPISAKPTIKPQVSKLASSLRSLEVGPAPSIVNKPSTTTIPAALKEEDEGI
jgi:hypothetical protein